MDLTTFTKLANALLHEWPKKERKKVVLVSDGFSIADLDKPYTIEITVDKAAKTIRLSGGN